ncbi:hypothetical protein E3T61_16305 [Cryobacterium lactosi]|uniref:Uncharacterized protein n=1 Tax=Cryobacterium lactosi TaxID=1259202 RepID=A0A4R9BKP5_9MICO|nr:hypothetical protein [Cryobacterium lactosi]TFD86469.1 hypothetical protein E3T61_16305 [Cryobacterium lactosi]
MDSFTLISLYALILWVIVPAVGLLLLYGVVRVAVSRGLRDHQKWMEKNRPGGWAPPEQRSTMGQYLGFGVTPSDPPR